TRTGTILSVQPASPDIFTLFKPNDWNRMRLVVRGSKITVELNVKLVQDCDLARHAAKAKDTPGVKQAAGRIMLHANGGKVEFRNLMLTPLTTAAAFPPAPVDCAGRVARLSPDEQVKEVVEELKRLNPEYKGQST